MAKDGEEKNRPDCSVRYSLMVCDVQVETLEYERSTLIFRCNDTLGTNFSKFP